MPYSNIVELPVAFALPAVRLRLTRADRSMTVDTDSTVSGSPYQYLRRGMRLRASTSHEDVRLQPAANSAACATNFAPWPIWCRSAVGLVAPSPIASGLCEAREAGLCCPIVRGPDT